MGPLQPPTIPRPLPVGGASGPSDASWEQQLGLWNTDAGIVIAAEAGALVTDMDGNVLRGPSPDVVAANPVLHAKILSILRSAAAEDGIRRETPL